MEYLVCVDMVLFLNMENVCQYFKELLNVQQIQLSMELIANVFQVFTQ